MCGEWEVCGCGRMSWGSRCVESGRCVCTWEDELGEQMCGEWEVCGEWVWEDESMTLMVQRGGAWEFEQGYVVTAGDLTSGAPSVVQALSLRLLGLMVTITLPVLRASHAQWGKTIAV